jgi:hypothetical protein
MMSALMTGRHRRPIRVSATLLAATAVMTACSSPATPAPPATAPAAPAASAPPAPRLLGDLQPVVSVKELMRDMIDPASDFVFDSVGTTITRHGRAEKMPKTDADWDRIRFGAVTLAEGIYLLKVPRPFAPEGDENNSTGPDPPELSPAQITAKVAADPVQWNAMIEALRNVGLEVMEIVKRRDVDALWDAGEDLDQACEQCHLEYWYPGEQVLMPKLDRKLEELFGPRTGSTAKFGMTPGDRHDPPPPKR